MTVTVDDRQHNDCFLSLGSCSDHPGGLQIAATAPDQPQKIENV